MAAPLSGLVCYVAAAHCPSPAGLTRGSIFFVRTFHEDDGLPGEAPAMTVFVVSREMERDSNGYARSAREGIETSRRDIRRRGGGAANESVRRLRRAAAK